jgi:predicted TIM-barrel fold metal-dependent hydrolase
MAALATGGLERLAFAQQSPRIDIHHHWHPPPIAWAFDGLAIGPAWPGDEWSLQQALNLLDRFAIQTAILSIRNPRRRVSPDDCREVNELAATIVSKYPRRFGAFALLPQVDFDDAAAEAVYALDTLKLDGVLLNASVDNHYLGAAEYEPLMTELNQRRAVVLMHPTAPAYFSELGLELRSSLIEYVFETTRAIANLIVSGSIERYPEVRLIAPHGGGTAPYIAARLDENATRWHPELAEQAPKGVLHYLKTFYFSTAQATSRYAFKSLFELVDSSRVLFGTDLPVSPPELVEEYDTVFDAYTDLNAEDREAIFRGNALRLFPRLA